VWQPARSQWWIIWAVALLVILAWPPDEGRSLGAKALSRAVDPTNSLPALPTQLPIGLDDDGDAVAAHDLQERSYFDYRNRSALMRWRLAARDATDPFERSTQRQLLVGLIVLAALTVWRMDGSVTR
jgi:hypothetical protein